MSLVRSDSAPNHNADQRTKMKRDKKARLERDNLEGAAAGHENKGPANKQKQNHDHSTHLKARHLGHENARDRGQDRKFADRI